jgi:hypothetical protein
VNHAEACGEHRSTAENSSSRPRESGRILGVGREKQ